MQRHQRVVGDLARPHQIPQRGKHGLVAVGEFGLLCCADQIAPERRTAPVEVGSERVVDGFRGEIIVVGNRSEQPNLISIHQADTPVTDTNRAGADPDHLAHSAELIEIA